VSEMPEAENIQLGTRFDEMSDKYLYKYPNRREGISQDTCSDMDLWTKDCFLNVNCVAQTTTVENMSQMNACSSTI
jgi:hypothetical protein